MKALRIDDPGSLISEATLTRQSFGTGELQFSRPCASLDEIQPFAIGDEYTVTRGTETIIVGTVTQCERQLSASGYYWAVTISDFWWYLENCLYISYSTDKGTVAPAAHIYLQAGSGEAPRATMPLGDALNQILSNNTRFASIDWDLEIDEAAEIIPFTADLTKHADLLRACQKWRPTLASYWDYTTPDAPRLVITDAGDVVTIDRADLLTDVVLRPRPDLIPPAVGILGTGTSTANSKVYTMSVWPEGGDDLLKEPYALTMAVNLPSGTQTKSGNETTDNANQAAVDAAAHTSAAFAPRMVVRGKAFPPDDMAAWWQDHLPLLKDAQLLVERTPTITAIDSAAKDVGGYAGIQLSHEFVSGQHNGNERIRWSEVQVTQRVLHRGKPAVTIAGYFPIKRDDGNFEGEFSATFYMIDTHYYSYAIDGANTPLGGDGEPEPEPEPYEPPNPEESEVQIYDQVVKSVFEANQKLEYEGAITVIGGPAVQTGMRLNLTGTAAEYAAMQATVQTVSTDLATGARTINVGPAAHLSIQTMIERARALQNQSAGGDIAKEDAAINQPNGSTSAQMPDDPRPDAPMLSPKWEFNVSSGPSDTSAAFTIRTVENDDGSVQYEYQQGVVLGPVDSTTVGQAGWNSLSVTEGPVYCNITLDYQGRITSATISDQDMGEARPDIYAYGRQGISGDQYRPGQGAPFDPEGATYSVQIADISNKVVTIHHIGVITLPLLPHYILYEIDDYTNDPTENKTNASPNAASLILTKEETHAYLRKIAPGEGIKFGRFDDTSEVPPAGEIRIHATALPSRTPSQADGIELFDEEERTDTSTGKKTKVYGFFNLRPMTIAEEQALISQDASLGAPCQVRIDRVDGTHEIRIGAFWGTYASGV